MIELNNVSKRFGSVLVLDDISLAIAKGSRLAVVGASGSGKTTLLRLIAGLDLPDAGEIRMGGSLVSDSRRALAPHLRGIGFAFQKPCLWPHMTVAQNVLFPIESLSRSARRNRLEETLLLTGLTELAGRYPAELSGGQERRVAIARAMAAQPSILLMDEPLTNLDADAKHDFLSLVLKTVTNIGCTLIYVTHEMTELKSIVNEVVMIEKGRLGIVPDGVSR